MTEHDIDEQSFEEWEFNQRQAISTLAGSDLQREVCRVASDYYYAVQNPLFAEMYGGAEVFKRQLFSLIDQWKEALYEAL